MNLSFQVHTFGCKVNTYDSGLIEKRLAASGFSPVGSSPNGRAGGGAAQPRIHVLNTCAVTSEATREAARMARRLKARDPFCLVVATGCAAQVDTIELSRQSAIDLIVANSHKGELHQIVERHLKGVLEERVFKSNIFKKEDLEAGGGVDSLHTRSFLKIQDGCDSFCTFCVIPFARGKSRSIPVQNLVNRVRELHANDVSEVVLTGVHIGDYRDGGHGLAQLVSAMLEQTEIPRLRLSSLEPVELSSEILDLFANPRLCPHFHMSIQSADTETLARMKRCYGAREVEAALFEIAARVPSAYVGMDVIAGFPGESAAQFDNTFQRLETLPWTRIHVFPYSRRPGTYASRLDGVNPRDIKERAASLRELSQRRQWLMAERQIGLTKQVLRLRSGANSGIGIARDFWPVELPQAIDSCAKEFTVHITGVSSAKSMGPVLVASAAGI